MKFIILTFALLCFIHTEAQAVNKDIITKYGQCAEYIETNGKITGCSKCHAGHKKSGDKCIIDTTDQYPGYGCNDGTCEFYDIRYDGKTKCTNELELVDAAGNKIDGSTDTCLACAKFTSNGVCEKCATGYILNGQKCIPLDSIELFGQNDPTNENCVHGQIETNGPVCEACNNLFKVQDGKCVKNDLGEDTLKGCVRGYFDNSNAFNCKECREGYILDEKVCRKLPNNCADGKVVVDVDGKKTTQCSKCMTGYFSNEITGCSVCKIPDNINPQIFNGDVCRLVDQLHCEECNPHCERDTFSGYCNSKHCDLFDDSYKCVRCEQGYVLNQNGKCIEREGCRNVDTDLCEKGYYETEGGVCKKCKGDCIECYSEDICKEGSNLHTEGYSVKGLPCFDPHCDLCSSENPHVCLKCKEYKDDDPLAETLILRNGRCYVQYKSGYALGSFNPYDACRYFEEPDFSSNTSATITEDMLDGSYIRKSSVAFTHSSNKVNDNYLCEYHDLIPYYYQYDGDTIQCAGGNRSANNDCECKEGYYAEDVHKFSDCKKFERDPNCVLPLSEYVCGKCREGLIMTKYEDNGEKYECGCPDGYRVSEDGVCIPCPVNCMNCRTDHSTGKAQCFGCKGFVNSQEDLYIANDFFRDKTQECVCKPGYAAYEDPLQKTIYACHPIPEECKGEGEYIAAEYKVRCTTCATPGLDYTSDCSTCLSGYREEIDASNKKTCIQCPSIPDTSVTGCSACQTKDGEISCNSCIDGYMEQSNKCQTCQPGTSLKYVTDGTKVTPFCMECPPYCKKTGTDAGCFYDVKGASVNNNKKDKGTFGNPYTLEDIEGDNIEKFCYACSEDNQDPWTDCDCGAGRFRYNDVCTLCTDIAKMEEFKHLDVSACDLSAGCEVTNDEVLPFKCKACKSNFNQRKLSTNCVECTDVKQYPDDSSSNGGCTVCPSVCERCSNKDVCTQCPQIKVDEPLITGAKCNECVDKYFVNGTENGKTKCSACDANCQKCSGSKNNCLECTDQYHVPSATNGCAQCIDGYYYDPISTECFAVTTANGYLESEMACKMKDGKLVNCKDVKESEKENVAEKFERAVKCDTSIKGVALEPVDGKCVCKTGFIDDRDAAAIAASPKPECKDVRGLTEDDFCIDAVMNSDGTFTCQKCNADYLELKNGVCTCKEGYYTTSWGACVPCGRHMKGCTKCEKCKDDERGDDCADKKAVCQQCESGYSLKDGACHAN